MPLIRDRIRDGDAVAAFADDALDAILVRTARGDSTALATLFERYAQQVYRTAVRLMDSADEADDVVQDVFVGLPEALSRYTERGAFEPWLRTVTARVALMRLRSARARERTQEIANPVATTGDDATERITLREAIARLPVDQRTVFALKVMEGYSHAEIGTLLGIRRGTSEVRLFRAIQKLRAILEGD